MMNKKSDQSIVKKSSTFHLHPSSTLSHLPPSSTSTNKKSNKLVPKLPELSCRLLNMDVAKMSDWGGGDKGNKMPFS